MFSLSSLGSFQFPLVCQDLGPPFIAPVPSSHQLQSPHALDRGGLFSDSHLLQSWAPSFWGFQLSMDCVIFSTSIPMLDEVGKYSYCG